MCAGMGRVIELFTVTSRDAFHRVSNVLEESRARWNALRSIS